MGVSKTNKDVSQQSSVDNFFQYTGIRELKNDITLTTQVQKDDVIINVSSGHGFVIGDILTIWEDTRFEQTEVILVTVDAITITIPSASVFSVAGARVVRGNSNLNVDGSVTPVSVLFKTYNSFVPIDISKTVILMSHSAAADDSKFGGITALINGIYFRKEDGVRTNFGNYRNNIDFKGFGATVAYTDKAGGGTYATEITFDFVTIFGRELRLNTRLEEFICGVIRDDLSGLSGLKVVLTGSFTEGE